MRDIDDDVTTQGGAKRGPTARVLLVFAGEQPLAITLPDAPTLTIGRGADVDLRIDDRSLSRTHARLQLGSHVTLEDLSSHNGTFIGGIRLTPGRPVVVAPGATLQFGNVAAILHFGTNFTPTLIGTSDGSRDGDRALEHVIARIALTGMSVLLTGETGVGKNTLARRLHDSSRHAAGPYLVLAASAVGHAAQDGTLANLARGTLVIDEPIDLDLGAGRLLIGAVSAMSEPPRLVATSSRDLRAEVAAARFSADLYHRLAGITIVVPPLRERVHEIATLAQAISAESARTSGRAPPIFSPDALALFERQAWPGNVRELASRIASAMAISNSRVLTASHFPDLAAEPRSHQVGAARVEAGRGALREARERGEYQQIIEALRATHGNQTRAAEVLGISRSTLLARLAKYNVPRPRK